MYGHFHFSFSGSPLWHPAKFSRHDPLREHTRSEMSGRTRMRALLRGFLRPKVGSSTGDCTKLATVGRRYAALQEQHRALASARVLTSVRLWRSLAPQVCVELRRRQGGKGGAVGGRNRQDRAPRRDCNREMALPHPTAAPRRGRGSWSAQRICFGVVCAGLAQPPQQTQCAQHGHVPRHCESHQGAPAGPGRRGGHLARGGPCILCGPRLQKCPGQPSVCEYLLPWMLLMHGNDARTRRHLKNFYFVGSGRLTAHDTHIARQFSQNFTELMDRTPESAVANLVQVSQ